MKTIIKLSTLTLTVIVSSIAFLNTFAFGQTEMSYPATQGSAYASAEDYKSEICSLLDQDTPSSLLRAKSLNKEAIRIYPKEDAFFRYKYFLYMIDEDYASALGPAETAYNLNPAEFKNVGNFLAAIIANANRTEDDNDEKISNPFAKQYYGKGLKAAEILIKTDKYRAKGYFNRAILHFQFGENESALTDINHAISLAEAQKIVIPQRESNNPYDIRARIHSILGNYEQALRDFNIAVNEYHVHEALKHRAFHFFKHDKFNEALRDYNAILQVEPGDLDSRDNRAACFMWLGINDKAIEDQKYIVAASPRDPEAHFEMAIIYTAARQVENAKASLKNTIDLSPDGSEKDLLARLMLLQIDSPDFFDGPDVPQLLRDLE